MISALTSRKRTVELLKRVVNNFLDQKGVVMGINSLGQRKLAYDIRKNKVISWSLFVALHSSIFLICTSLLSAASAIALIPLGDT